MIERKNCISCNSTKLKEIKNFGNMPWCNNFLIKKQVGREPFYPLILMFCKDCGLLQLSYFVSRQIMFSNHDYLSGTTKTLAEHFYKISEENKKEFNLQPNDLIVDIGSNDGTFLLQNIKLGLNNVLGIESANNIAKISERNKIPTINEFFNEEVANKIIKSKGKAKLINASGVFFHLEELHSVIKGIKKLLADDGIFIVQFMYAKDIIKKCNFDSIYSEHLCYYTLNTLERLLLPYNLQIFDAYHSDIHSGSIIAKVKHSKIIDGRRATKTERYFTTKFNDEITEEDYNNFIKKIDDITSNLKDLLLHFKRDLAMTIYTLGAPAKGNTLLNYLQSKYLPKLNQIITKATEINEHKINKYTPGTHIPVIKESKDDIPNVYLLLSHNFLKEIITKNIDIITNLDVHFIVPFPELIVINKDNYKDHV